jgi:hypothetical protein
MKSVYPPVTSQLMDWSQALQAMRDGAYVQAGGPLDDVRIKRVQIQ